MDGNAEGNQEGESNLKSPSSWAGVVNPLASLTFRQIECEVRTTSKLLAISLVRHDGETVLALDKQMNNVCMKG